MKEWFKKGEHWVWFSASTVSISVVLVVGLLLMISFRGLVHFWPHSVYEYEVKTDNGKLEQVVGELHEVKSKEFKDPKAEDGIVRIPQYLLKVGNRDVYGI